MINKFGNSPGCLLLMGILSSFLATSFLYRNLIWGRDRLQLLLSSSRGDWSCTLGVLNYILFATGRVWRHFFSFCSFILNIRKTKMTSMTTFALNMLNKLELKILWPGCKLQWCILLTKLTQFWLKHNSYSMVIYLNFADISDWMLLNFYFFILMKFSQQLRFNWERERLSLSAFVRTEDIGVHIVHISRLIITYTLE